jgi:hypothetical protein
MNSNKGWLTALIFLVIIAGLAISINFYLPFWRSPQRVRQSLCHLDTNQNELLAAMQFYQKLADPEKLNSLYFLLENLYLHNFAEICLQNEEDKEIPFDASNYKDLATAQEALERLEDIHGNLKWSVKKIERDEETITADLLIENIENAHDVWQNQPWSKNYDMNTFQNYILPYRGSSEPLESFRIYCRSRFESIISTADPVLAAAAINDSLKKIFKFESRYYLHPTDQGFNEMLIDGKGRCEDMTNFAIYALRANGIAVTSDYTPHWADSGNNHAWNAIITPDNRAIPFMGCESNPLEYKLRKRIAKVYRKMFAVQENSLGCLLDNDDSAPPWLRGKNYLDVTPDYVPTASVSIETSQADNEKFLYLAVFNSGSFKAIAFAPLQNGIAVFQNVGTNLAYLPAIYKNDEIVPAGKPFLLNSDGKKEILVAIDDLQDMQLFSTIALKIRNNSGRADATNLKAGSVYELYYWLDDWKLAASGSLTDESLVFKDIPAQALYWLREKDSKKDERIFIYRDGKQIWF